MRIMRNKKRDFIFIQDGKQIPEKLFNEIHEQISDKDYLVKNEKYIANFVGFIITKEFVITSLPKHFINNTDELIESNDALNNAELLLAVINKYFQSSRNQFIFENTERASDSYPFIPFQEVWQWYKRYGLLIRKSNEYKKGYTGKVNWKQTISKSTPVINNNNILFFPFVVRETITKFDFISYCMAYVINKTISIFPFKLNVHPIELDSSGIESMKYSEIVSRLKSLRNMTFKNIEVSLINSLITYFSNENYEGDTYKLKIYKFSYVWEDILNEYLKYHLIGFLDNGDLVFNDKVKNERPYINFDYNRSFEDIDESSNKYHIKPDFYSATENTVFIFDAKYYVNVSDLDYKQLSYHFILSNRRKNTYNYLLLPTVGKYYNKLHFSLSDLYITDVNVVGDLEEETENIDTVAIYESYINMKNAMRKYIQ